MSGHTRSLDFVDVEPLLAPRSIAVIGASDDPSNLGGVAVRRLQKFGYPGPIWPVHPRAQEVAGLPCFAKVGDLPEPAELAVFAVAAERVVDLVAECADFGIRHGIVFAGGFVDDGPEGARLQAELENTCRATGFSLLGPNCLGVINAQMPMTATFAAYLVEKGDLMPGGLSIAGQSGGLVTMAAALARSQGFGVRYVVSTGNEALVTTADFVHAFVRDEQTRVIALYLEGSRDGAKFLEALIAARTAGKPVVVLKAGSTRVCSSRSRTYRSARWRSSRLGGGTSRIRNPSVFARRAARRVAPPEWYRWKCHSRGQSRSDRHLLRRERCSFCRSV